MWSYAPVHFGFLLSLSSGVFFKKALNLDGYHGVVFFCFPTPSRSCREPRGQRDIFGILFRRTDIEIDLCLSVLHPHSFLLIYLRYTFLCWTFYVFFFSLRPWIDRITMVYDECLYLTWNRQNNKREKRRKMDVSIEHEHCIYICRVLCFSLNRGLSGNTILFILWRADEEPHWVFWGGNGMIWKLYIAIAYSCSYGHILKWDMYTRIGQSRKRANISANNSNP